MTRRYCDRKIEELKKVVDEIEDVFDDYFEEIIDEIDSLVIDIREERLTDIKKNECELIGIRDRISTH